ncbi:MAG: hypothetical protein MUF15_21430, partial [Acidobacteria bacterium]|nr:hypothetical protein [Acidobacteriota bacterium]
MKAAVKRFAEFQVSGQLEFLMSGDFTSWERHEKIAFLKAVLKEGLSSKTITAILELLRELNYLDKFFFSHYQYHIDESVANAAKKVIIQKVEKNDSTCARLINMLKEGSS